MPCPGAVITTATIREWELDREPRPAALTPAADHGAAASGGHVCAEAVLALSRGALRLPGPLRHACSSGRQTSIRAASRREQ